MASRCSAVLGMVAAAAISAQSANGQTFSVTGTGDGTTPCAGTVCPSLRSAITAANALPGPDEIGLNAGTYRITIGAAAPEDKNASGDLDVTDDLTVKGRSAEATTIMGALPANQGERNIHVPGNANLTLSDMSIAGGRDGENAPFSLGGGIYGAGGGTLRLERVVAHDNLSQGRASYGDGGAVAVTGGGRLVVNDSAFLSNQASGAGYGGAIYFGGTSTSAALTNVTFAGNSATAHGGAIESDATGRIQLDFVTIFGNQAGGQGGGGIGNADGIHLRNSIVGGNTAPSGANCSRTPASDGGNVADAACSLALPSDVQALDPKLGTLGGSPIPAFLPQADSPALDRAVGSCPPTDLLGVVRPQGRACDAGAAERPVSPPGTTTTATTTPTTTTTRTNPPNTSITRATLNSAPGKATFRFKATGKSTGFQCALVSAQHRRPVFRSCRSPKTYTKLGRGKYTFKVRAVGPGGRDRSPAMTAFRIT